MTTEHLKTVTIRPNPDYTNFEKFTKVNQRRLGQASATGTNVQSVKDITKNYTRVPNSSVSLGFQINYKNPTRLYTGELDSVVDNPHYDEEVNCSDSRLKKYLMTTRKVRFHHLLELKHNVAFNYYTSQLSNETEQVGKRKKVKRIALQEPKYRLELRDGYNSLDLSNPVDEVKYYLARSNSKVANSYDEMTSAPTQFMFYIASKEEDQKLVARANMERDKAVFNLQAIHSKSPDVLPKMTIALSKPEPQESVDAAYGELRNYINSSRQAAITFNKYAAMVQDVSKRSQFYAYVTLNSCLKYSIMRRDGSAIKWFTPTQRIQLDEDGKDIYNPPKDGIVEFSRVEGQNGVIDYLTSKAYAQEQEVIKRQLAIKIKNEQNLID